MAAYRRALAFDPALRLADSDALNAICAYGDSERYAADIIHACDLAVDFDPEYGNFHYNHAFVRMQLDDLAGAAEDFEEFIPWANGHREAEEHQAVARSFIEKLKVGVNPLKEAMPVPTPVP
jgi:hypothetical protein